MGIDEKFDPLHKTAAKTPKWCITWNIFVEFNVCCQIRPFLCFMFYLQNDQNSKFPAEDTKNHGVNEWGKYHGTATTIVNAWNVLSNKRQFSIVLWFLQ